MDREDKADLGKHPKSLAKAGQWVKLVAFALVVVFLTLFVLRNGKPVDVDFVVAPVPIPLRLVILGSAALGVVGTLLAIAFRNVIRKQKKTKGGAK